MSAATILPRRRRGISKIAVAATALVMAAGGVSVALVADTAGAAAPVKKPCAGNSCKNSSTTGTASPTPTATAPVEAAPAPSPTATPTAQPTTNTPAPDPTPTAQQSTEAPAPQPSPSSTSSTSSGGDTSGAWVSPEGVRISVDPAVSGWTPSKVYSVLSANAYQLNLVGPSLKIVVSNDPGNSTSTGAGTSGSVYTNFSAITYLSARDDSILNTKPDQVVAHEYGHAWTLYHLYLTQQKDWTRYLQIRGLVGDARLDSTYLWDRKELIADDYRMLFGNPAAVSGAAYINRDVTDPRQVPGLKQFFIDTWA